MSFGLSSFADGTVLFRTLKCNLRLVKFLLTFLDKLHVYEMSVTGEVWILVTMSGKFMSGKWFF